MKAFGLIRNVSTYLPSYMASYAQQAVIFKLKYVCSVQTVFGRFERSIRHRRICWLPATPIIIWWPPKTNKWTDNRRHWGSVSPSVYSLLAYAHQKCLMLDSFCLPCIFRNCSPRSYCTRLYDETYIETTCLLPRVSMCYLVFYFDIRYSKDGVLFLLMGSVQ
jgi:hypothetical protein